jgi:hypothetical protein
VKASPARRLVSGLAARLGVDRWELGALAGILAVGAVARFANLAARGGWDADQAVEMAALRQALSGGGLPTFGPEAISVGASFHHGALYYDLLLPAAWLGNGDPTFVVAEIALLSLVVIPIVWWLGRTMAGPAAGLIAALLAALSASLIGYATFIWNPTLVEPGAAVAFLGAWQAWRTGRPGWWIGAAAGTAVAMQSQVAAAVLVLPMAVVFVATLWRGPAGARRRIAAWGVAGVALVVVTYLPALASELGHDFADSRGMIAYLTGPDSTPARDPLTRLLFSAVRILAWPLTRWPLVDLKPAFLPAAAVALLLAFGLVWRALATGSRRRASGPTPAVAPQASASASTPDLPASASAPNRPARELAPRIAFPFERAGVFFTGGLLLSIVAALGLGLKAVSEVQDLPTEQYHVVADPLVFVAAGLVLAGLWRAGRAPRRGRGAEDPAPRRWAPLLCRATVLVALIALAAWNVWRWPPLTSPDGGWPAARAAAERIERDAAGSSIGLVPLFAPKGVDAYSYPLALAGVALVPPERATTVAVLCDSYWLTGCRGPAEAAWQAGQPGTLTLIERFDAAPDRIISVYRRAP